MARARPTTRSPTSRRCATLDGARAARARPAAVPDGAARAASAGFTRVSWDEALDLDRRRASARRRPTASALYLTARGITNEVYYVAQKAARFHRHQQRRQRGARVPRAVDDRAEADDRRRRDHVLVHRRDRQRPHRAVRRQRRQRPAGVHEVPVPRAQARARRSRWSTRCASPGSSATGCRRNVESAMFGTKMTDEFFAGPHRRRRRVRQRRAEGAARRRAAIDRELRRRAHRRASTTLLAELERESFDDLERQSGATRADMERFARMYAAAPSRRCWCGRWASPSTSTASTTCARS